MLNAEDPGFPQAVALRVAQWSGEGVQQATLDLHPAELGPIQIRIDVEGKEARIHFGAVHERTRALLDEAVPALAQALQSDGLSLAASQVTDVIKPLEASSAENRSGGPRDGLPSPKGEAGGQGESSGRQPPAETGAARQGREWGGSGPRSTDPGAGGVAESPAKPAPAWRSGRLSLDLYA